MSVEEQDFYHEIRLLQKRTRCSNYVCNQFVEAFQKHANGAKTNKIKLFDKKAQKIAGSEFMVLHGCPECNHHVYKPEDKHTNCPFVKEDGSICGYSRFDEFNEPYEVCIVCFLFIVLLIV